MEREDPKFASDPVDCKLQARINDCEGCDIGPCAELVAIFPGGKEVVLIMLSCPEDVTVGEAVQLQLLSGLILQRMEKRNETSKGKVDEAHEASDVPVSCDMIMRHAYGLEEE